MSRALVICEKPSVAADLAKVLGARKSSPSLYESDQYLIGFAVGHLLEQVDPEAYDPRYKSWRFEDLPIVPDRFRYAPRDEKSKRQLAGLRAAARRDDVDEIINACDAGREGELIFKLILEASGVTKPVRRAWFSSMTTKAVREAFANLRDDAEMQPLEAAARSRSEADWLVGMNASRAATTKIGSRRAALSLGRVQTPTLALVVGRDLEIDAFTPEDYWQVRSAFATADGAHYNGLWHRGASERLTSGDEAERIASAVRGASGVVASVERKPVRETAPMLYDLTTLQRDANQRLGFTAGRTLSAAQALYEQHKLITYPRTNSRYLTGDLIETLRPIARAVGSSLGELKEAAAYVAGLDVLPLGRVVNDARVSDHHAIIPTDESGRIEALGGDQRRVYDLVARRFLAVFHPDAEYEQTLVETAVGDEQFRSRGRVVIKAGWRSVYGRSDHERDDDDRDQKLPLLESGAAVSVTSVDVLAKQTKPPAHYTDATLLRAMETAGRLVDDDEAAEAMKDSGLGTPATRAATIERLIEKDYMEREGRSLRATDRGIGLVGALSGHDITSPVLTGRWEQRLSAIEAGRESRDAFMRDIRDFTADTVEWFVDKDRSAMRAHRRVIGPCPRCDGQIVERPRSYSCTSWRSRDEPGCGFQIWKQIGGVTITPEAAAAYVEQGLSSDDIEPERVVIGPCPTPGCGGDIIERQRSYGCTSWQSRTEPGCGFVIWKRVRGQPEVTPDAARDLLAQGVSNAPPAPKREPLGPCPTPGCEGQIIENQRAFGCTSWKSRTTPGCGFVIWKRPRGGSEVTREQAMQMLASGTYAQPARTALPRVTLGPCPTPGCGGEIVEKTRAFGCTSWKSRSKPGCGFVIWKRPHDLGRELTVEEASDLLRRGLRELPATTDAA